MILLAAAAAGGAVFCLVVGLFWDFRDLGRDTGGTSFRRGPHGDPWRRR